MHKIPVFTLFILSVFSLGFTYEKIPVEEGDVVLVTALESEEGAPVGQRVPVSFTVVEDIFHLAIGAWEQEEVEVPVYGVYRYEVPFTGVLIIYLPVDDVRIRVKDACPCEQGEGQ